MKIIAIDDELLALHMLTDTIRKAVPEAEIFAFSKPSEVLVCAEENTCEVAFLDIRMRTMTGLELARRLKDLQPKINIIFVTGYNEYTGEAMNLHASGYIEKPVTAEKVRRELDDLRHPIQTKKVDALLRVDCFGCFEAFLPNGEPLRFERAKSKECFAYLVSRCGNACTVRELAGILFEDQPYDHKQANYMQKIITAMHKALKSAGVGQILRKGYNEFAVVPELLDCDYYRFRQGDVTAVNRYQGEFMLQYPWAEFITGYLEQSMQK